jgi:hypothetical protein
MSVLLIFLVSLTISLDVPLTDAAERGNFAGLVELGGGRKMYLKCSGRGSPTVVLVGGLRASADDWIISDKSKPPVFLRLLSSPAYVHAIVPERLLVKSPAAAIQSRSRAQRRMQLPIYTPC